MYTSWDNTSRLLMEHINFNSRPSMCTLIVLFRLLIKRLLPFLRILTHVAYPPFIICALTHPITPLSLYTYCLHSVITIIGSTTLQISYPYPFCFILIETAGESERDKVLIESQKVTAIIDKIKTRHSFRKKTC